MCVGRWPWKFSAIANTAGFCHIGNVWYDDDRGGSGDDRTTLEGNDKPYAFMDTEDSMIGAGWGMTGAVGEG